MTTRRASRIDRAAVRGYVVVPMLTPFTPEGALDEEAAGRVVRHILDGGCQALLVGGTTGEAASMTARDRVRLVELAAEGMGGRGLLFAGIGENSLAQALELGRASLAAGAQALVAHLPSYYPIEAPEMQAWFTALADRLEAPLFLYNIPQTTRHSIPLDVLEALSRHPRIGGVKDSEPDADRQENIARHFAGREDFIVFCGTVPSTVRAMRAGADGYVPSGGNITPVLARELVDRILAGDAAGSEALQARINGVSQIYQKGRTLGRSLSALKAAASILGLCGPHMLPPLRALDASGIEAVRQAMAAAGDPK